jgi:hypothetical protein
MTHVSISASSTMAALTLLQQAASASLNLNFNGYGNNDAMQNENKYPSLFVGLSRLLIFLLIINL